jgi:hypothetical protein
VPPKNHLYASATWLLGRHPVLADLAQRIPGAVVGNEDGPYIDLDLLAAAISSVEEDAQAWRAYESSHPAPESDEDPGRYQDWCDAGPQRSRATAAFMVMSPSEQSRLRLLAAFGGRMRVPFSVGDLYGFDDAGRRLIQDWCLAVCNA